MVPSTPVRLRRLAPARLLTALVTLLALVVVPFPTPAALAGEDNPAFERIATEDVTLPDALGDDLAEGDAGRLAWQGAWFTTLAEGDDPVPFAPGFLYASDGDALVYRDDGRFSQVRVGRAMGMPAVTDLAPVSRADSPVDLIAIELILAGDEAADDDSFAVTDGEWTLDLWRLEIPAGETDPVSLPAVTASASGEATPPVLVMVVDGTVDLATGPDADETDQFTGGDGGRTVPATATVVGTNEAATFLVATIAPAGDPASPAASEAGTQDADGPAAPPAGGTAGDAPARPPTPSSPSTSPAPDPPTTDTDGDGLPDAEEQTLGTDPANADTDEDFLSDGTEVNVQGTDPLDPDTDDDDLSDGAEVNIWRSNPHLLNTDGDSIPDGVEVNRYGTDPGTMGTDADALDDDDEIFIHGTDARNPDTDGDCVRDSSELYVGMDPLLADTDGDGKTDGHDDEFLVYDPAVPPVSDADAWCV